MRFFALSLVLLTLAGCGGEDHRSPRASSDRPIRLIASDPGTVLFTGTATVPSSSNAGPGGLALASGRRFYGEFDAPDGRDRVRLEFVDTKGHSLRLDLYASQERFGVGDVLDLSDAGEAKITYEEIESHSKYRSWSTRSGKVVIDEATSDAIAFHVSEARMALDDESRCNDSELNPDGCVSNSARGQFTLALQSNLPRTKGQIAFETRDTDFDAAPIDADSGLLLAFSSAHELDLTAYGSGERIVQIQLFPGSDSVFAGESFMIDGRRNFGSVFGLNAQGPHSWLAASGIATVREIHGRQVTIDLAGVTFMPSDGATGTLVVNGSMTVLVP